MWKRRNLFGSPVLRVLMAAWLLTTLALAAPARAQSFGLAGPTAEMPRPLPSPLLAAGDEQFLWLAVPVRIREANATQEAFALLQHHVNAQEQGRDRWDRAEVDLQHYFLGRPAVITALTVPSPDSRKGYQSIAYVMMADGRFLAYGPDANRELFRLPRGHEPVAGAAGNNAIWVLARGVAPAAGSASQPATTAASQPAAGPASAPATSTAPAAGTQSVSPTSTADTWYLHQFTKGNWNGVWTLGPIGAADTPAADTRPRLVWQGGRVWILWADPGQARILKVRALGFAEKGGGWSAVWSRMLPDPLTGKENRRLMVVGIEPRIYVLWAAADTAAGVELHGLALRPNGLDGPLEATPLEPMNLGPASAGLRAQTDLAAGRTGTSLAVMYAARDGSLGSATFDGNGKLLGTSVIEPTSATSGESPGLTNLIFLAIMAVLTVLMWQWRQRPMAARLPVQWRPASLPRRIGAALIDLAIPLVIVAVIFGLHQPGAWAVMGERWNQLSQQSQSFVQVLFEFLQQFLEWQPVLWLLGGYIAHVTVGELLTGRSLGKALLGLHVVAIDGSRPTLIATLVRNLVRIPEFGTFGILFLFVFLNDQRQRLGDVLGRTVVVGPNPEAPKPPPDAPEPTAADRDDLPPDPPTAG